jgi:hypothetical protein
MFEETVKNTSKRSPSSHGNFFYDRNKFHPVRFKGFHDEKKETADRRPVAFVPQPLQLVD